MKGIAFNYNSDTQYVSLILLPGDMEKEADMDWIKNALQENGYGDFYLSQKALKSACDKANLCFKTGDKTEVSAEIAQLRHAEVDFTISEDNLSATLRLTTPYGGRMPNAITIRNLAYKNRITRGVGMRHINNLLKAAERAEPGKVFEEIIAKGLPPRTGKGCRFIPLVPNALERILRPQLDENSKSDLRNLGDVICVKTGTPVLRRTPPTQGRKGFDVRGNVLYPKPGEWTDFKMGTGTKVCEEDDNILLATKSGMPKYNDLRMNIDETFICNGVNVGTGHVTYDGAVLVNGDVAENMRIKATKDITINGFVESATIEAGGDIIITEGAMGKVTSNTDGYGCVLIAGGSIHVQHGQGIEIKAGKNLTVGRQLAYSKVQSGGSVTVGNIQKPMGNLFACDITCQDKVEAGTLGAISGSTLKVDFSEGMSALLERKESTEELLRQLRENNSRHREKLNVITNRILHKGLENKVSEAKSLLTNESALLNWLEQKAAELATMKEEYQRRICLKANKRIYAGVSAKLNNRNWRSEREYERCRIRYEGHKWHYEPDTSA
ncbi:DUF342 domain-containing protein [Alteromonas confluentis]|uniref:Flagellar Assembly Protein A N-terminal region domain-containing protein n=1 Tax=Alteromonas confluentis TaxID=1656094 RepID=A0A1E7ZGJ9_9ALTE|nr:FapA family protein [Alteromonas confluentis]OFC72645.1 hypothetical protein BFC18_02000 [Alteromonas confluentis]